MKNKIAHLNDAIKIKVVLQHIAHQQGTTADLLAIDSLTKLFMTLAGSPTREGETMTDFLGDFIGCIDSGEIVPGGANMSEFNGRKFGEILKKKHVEANLSDRERYNKSVDKWISD